MNIRKINIFVFVILLSSRNSFSSPEYYKYTVQKEDTLGNLLSRWGACPLWGKKRISRQNSPAQSQN